MNAYRSISLACALASAWLVGCNGQPGPGAAPRQPPVGGQAPAVDAPRAVPIAATSYEHHPIATESLSRLDSGARGEGIRPTRGASGLQP